MNPNRGRLCEQQGGKAADLVLRMILQAPGTPLFDALHA
jgi:hypothetical protein